MAKGPGGDGQMSNYKITKAQNKYLASLNCRRITNDPSFEEPIAKFRNWDNTELPNALRRAWEDIREGKDKGDVAHYIITDPDNEPMLFFSLKCGELYCPMFREKVATEFRKAKTIYETLRNGAGPRWAMEEIERRKQDGVLPEQELTKIQDNYLNRRYDYQSLESEMMTEHNDLVNRARKVYSGVEIVYFCKHEPADFIWQKAGMEAQSMGKTLFWHFIIPLIQKISSFVGCEYVYLFAADSSRKRELINFYEKLSFFEPKYISTTKPQYDFGCAFMCQQLKRLDVKKRSFFYNYNKPKDTP